jgi:hypothetical protein
MKKIGFILLISILTQSCTNAQNNAVRVFPAKALEVNDTLKVGAARTQMYLPLLKNKRVAVVANPTSTIGHTHLVDTLLSMGVQVVLEARRVQASTLKTEKTLKQACHSFRFMAKTKSHQQKC